MESASGEHATVTIQPDGLPAVEEAQKPPTTELRVQLGGHMVPFRWVLSWARHDCNVCHGGGRVTRLAPKTGQDFCACASSRAERELKAYLASLAKPVDVDPPARTPDAREQERITRKVDGLQRQLDALESEFGARKVRFDQGIEALVNDGKSHAIAVQDHSSSAIGASAHVEVLRGAIKDAEKRLAELRSALGNEIESMEAAERGRAMADSMLFDVSEEIQRRRVRFEKDNAGLRAEVDRARRRLNHAQALYGIKDPA